MTDPFANQAATDPFAAPTAEGADPFAPPRKGGGVVSPAITDLRGRLLAVKFLKDSLETSKFVKTGNTQVTVFHVNLAILDGGNVVASQQNEDYSTTKIELGVAPLVLPDYWVWQEGIRNSINKTGLTLGRLVRSPSKDAQKQFIDHVALENFFAANPNMVKDDNGPRWFWMLADPTDADRQMAMAWYRSNPTALNV